ncbi:aryl-alcohol-oxidase from pleurotus Eryingii [Collybia nuda]|uniref:Aryl-alcohol-oxidase from pleurotus Eryingii n=1 Tax=Collybia nuda TaxID=64659 RepID=A0A9P5XW67_9AGAR|nr:aryl-alcohol-oxidase from pleurotus Eryingii [Collybia nuda]
MHRFLLFLISASSWASFGTSKIIHSISDLQCSEYDFIIIGGGTAGSVLANRLSENPHNKVLVLEAGINNAGIQDVQVPFLGVTLPETSVDWNFTTTPQVGLNNRSIELARGFVLGGSSSINFMAWNRGSQDYWNSFVTATKNQMWSFTALEKYYRRTSTLVPPADGRDTTGDVDPTAYGNGPVQVSIPGFMTEIDNRVTESGKILGGRFSFIEDLNKGKTLGFAYAASSIGNGTRSSAATAYLEPILKRKNIDVLISTRVARVTGHAASKGITHIDTVEILQNPGDIPHQIKASKEVLLSAGVMGTPHILTLSGIGPKKVLKNLGINVVVAAEDVGANFADHPLVANYFSVNSNHTWDPVLRDPSLFAADLSEWVNSKQGLFVDTAGNTYGFMKLPHGFADPSTGPRSANTEIIFVNGFAPFGATIPPTTGSYLSMLTAVVSPTSRGTVTTVSRDPFAPPKIDLNIFTTDFDISAMVQVMKDARTLISASPWDGYIIGPFGELANATTDDQLATFARNNAVTVNHPVGTARISPDNARYGVVDSHLKVKGTSGLRVIDASVLPQIPECHPQALVYTIAERAADLIKADHGLL